MSTEDTPACIDRYQNDLVSALSRQPSVFGGTKKVFTPKEPLAKVVPPSASNIPPPPGIAGRDALPHLLPPPGYPLPVHRSLLSYPPLLSPFAPPGLPLLPAFAPPGLSWMPSPLLPPPGLPLPLFCIQPLPPALPPGLLDLLPQPLLPPPLPLLPIVHREQQKAIPNQKLNESRETKTRGERQKVLTPSIASSMSVKASESPLGLGLSPVPPEFKDPSFISSPSSVSGPSDFPTNDGWTDDDDLGPAVDDAVLGEFDPVPPRPRSMKLGAKLLRKLEAPPNTPSDSVTNLTATSQPGSKQNSFSYEPPHEDVLQRLNSSFRSLYMDTSRRMSVSPPLIAADGEPVAEGDFVEEKENQKKEEEQLAENPVSLSETLHSDISERFGGPSIPLISEEEHLENIRMLQQARAIINRKQMEAESNTDVLALIGRYFPKPNSIVADISQLPEELVSIIDTHPQLFCVECESPGEVGVRLCGEVTAEKLTAKSIRRANESDLLWLKSAATVIDPTKNDLTCVSPLAFIAPRGILISAFWGNDQGERVCYVSELIRNQMGTLKPVFDVKPGMPCLVRSDDDYARAVIIDKALKGFKLAFLDFYETTEAAPEDIFELPEQLGFDRIRCGLLLARMYEVDSVPLDCQTQVIEKIEELNSGKCTAAIIVAPKVAGDLCACDIVVNNNSDWLSSVIKSVDVILQENEAQDFGLLEVNDKIVERYSAGFYAFDTNQEPLGAEEEVIEVREEQLVDVSYSPPQAEEGDSVVPPAAVVNQEELVNFSTDTVEFHPSNHSEPPQLINDNESQEENRSFDAPPAESLESTEKLFHPPPPQQKHQIAEDYINHVRNYSAFVEATLPVLDKENVRKQFLYDSIAQAIFLKIHVVPAEAVEEHAAIDKLIGSLNGSLNEKTK